jgi:hypothetical protein
MSPPSRNATGSNRRNVAERREEARHGVPPAARAVRRGRIAAPVVFPFHVRIEQRENAGHVAAAEAGVDLLHGLDIA